MGKMLPKIILKFFDGAFWDLILWKWIIEIGLLTLSEKCCNNDKVGALIAGIFQKERKKTCIPKINDFSNWFDLEQ